MTNVIIAVHLAKIPGESCSSELATKMKESIFGV